MNKKYSIEKIKEFLKENDIETKLLSINYKNNGELLKWKCRCGEEYLRSWGHFKGSNQFYCKNCAEKNRLKKVRKRSQEYVESLYLEYGYELLDKYENLHKNMKCIDNNGYYFSISYKNLISYNNNRNKYKFAITNPYYKDNLLLFFRNNNKYEFIDCKINDNKKLLLKIKCNKCGYIYNISVFSFMNNKRMFNCRNCDSKSRTKTIEYVYNKYYENGFELLQGEKEKYTKNNKSLYCRNLKNNYIGRLTLNNVQFNSSFSLFRNNEYWDYNLELFLKKWDNKSKIIKDKSNIKEKKICLECPKCHKLFYIDLYSLRSGRSGYSCNNCNGSKSSLEIKTENWLINNNYKYTMEKTFDDCFFINKLRFDFCVYLEDKIILIECDGEQHEKPTKWGIEDYENTKKRDNIKNEYCKKNNIPLLRIKNKYFKSNKYKELLSNFIEINKM